MRRFRIQLLLNDNTWSTLYDIPKNDRSGNSSKQWTMVNLNFILKKNGKKLICHQLETQHADLRCSNIMITHSVL